MTALSEKRCPGCYQFLPEGLAWHGQCSRKLFLTPTPPELLHSLGEMQSLAELVIRSQSTITGVQSKISLDINKKGVNSRLTITGLWGRYLLKPPSSTYPGMVELEDLTLHLAQLSGIAVVPHGLITLSSGEYAFISRRIDRISKSKNVVNKLAMEDFCQLSGRLTEDKYKGSVEQIGKLIHKYSSQPGLDVVRIYELSVFCFLTGNSDMHLKNYSLFQEEDLAPNANELKSISFSWRLTPAYDLLPTQLLLPNDREESALTINGKKSNLRLKDFKALASSLGISEKVEKGMRDALLRKVNKYPSLIEASFVSKSQQGEFWKLIQNRVNRLI